MIEIPPKQAKSINAGISKSEMKCKIDSLLNLITLLPSNIVIFNNTKGCKVHSFINGSDLHIMITNPEDEVFKL